MASIIDLSEHITLLKSPTGIKEIDAITNGGLPKNRVTLVLGCSGSGKTMFAMEYLIHGALEYDEPGVFVSFQETQNELESNFSSLRYDLSDLIRIKKIAICYVDNKIDQMSNIFNFDIILAKILYVINTIGAKRVVIDSIEDLITGITRFNILRADLNHFFNSIKEMGVTIIATCEKKYSDIISPGIIERAVDCTILMDYRMDEKRLTRWLRIIKYRGSKHAMCEYPFIINENGLSIILDNDETGKTQTKPLFNTCDQKTDLFTR